MKVQVIRKSLKYGGKLYQVGQTFEMSDRDARVFRVAKRVINAPIVDTDTDLPAAPVAPVDLVETSAPLEVVGEFDHPGLDADASELLGEEPASAPAKPKRTYKRRDMKAE